jgi:hypothetical protein
MRELKEYPRPVAGYIVCAGGAAVVKVDYRLFAVLDNRVVVFAVYIHDCTDTAGIVFKPRVVQTLFFQLAYHILTPLTHLFRPVPYSIVLFLSIRNDNPEAGFGAKQRCSARKIPASAQYSCAEVGKGVSSEPTTPKALY